VIGTTVQHYRIGERLGGGGMGEVYRGEDIRLGRPVALKFLPQSLKADPESRARLLTEARAASLLRSPNIAVTYDLGEFDNTDFIVMEYVEGELLSTRVSRGSLPVREVVEVGLQVTDALDEAHTRGIVHRDIKSGNLMWTERGLVKVLDFGLAKFLRNAMAEGTTVTQPQVTMAGMVVGTVSYMAPEQALGRDVDHRSDLFSLGVVLRALDGQAAVRRWFRHGDHRSDSARDAAAPLAVHISRARGARCRDSPCAREVAGLPLPVRSGDARRPAIARPGAGRRAARPDEPGVDGAAAAAARGELRCRHDVREHHA
jgi:serine/threonine protein kinase